MFAKLTGYYQTVDRGSRFVLSQGWSDCTWVSTAWEATKLSQAQADQLIGELNNRDSGPIYNAERDETGETNQPPYGLDNFVVTKT
jgi:hypothetical protein